MTTVDFNPAPRRGSRAAEWLGHYSLQAVVALYAVSFATERFTHGLANYALLPLLFGTALGLFWLQRRHDRRLCEPCAAALPLDAQARAASLPYAQALKTTHILVDLSLRFLLICFTVSVAMMFVPHNAWTDSGSKVAITALGVWALWSERTHFRLQAWCPQCNWGNGGDGIPEPSPDPVDSQPLPV